MSQFYFPTPNTSLKAAAVSLYASGMVVPALHDNDAWKFTLSNTALARTAVSGTAGASVSGYTSSCAGSGGMAWLLQESGALVALAVTGTTTAYALAASASYVGVAYHATQDRPYLINSSGVVETISGSGIVAITPNFNNQLTKFLDVSGTTLFTLLPAASNLGVVNITGATAGTTGVVATPMQTPGCLAASTTASAVAVGGTSLAVLSSGFQAIAAAPNGLTFAGVNTAAGRVNTWISSQGVFNFSNSVSGLVAPAYLGWGGTGTELLVTDPTNGRIYALTYTVGVLALAQTLTLAGAGPVGVTFDSLHALVCRTAAGVVQSYAYSGLTWTVSGSFNVGTPSSIFVSGDTAWIGCSSGIARALLTSGVWAVTATGAVGFTPTSITVDSSGNVYTGATVTGSGVFAISTSALALSASGSYIGANAGIVQTPGQIITADTVGNILRVFGGSSWTQQASAVAPTGVDAIAFGAGTLYAAGTAATYQYNMLVPFTPTQATSGAVSIYKGGVWATAPISGTPMAMTWNPSGGVDVVNDNNTLYTYTSGAVLVGSSGIPQNGTQPQTTPIGLSALTWFNGHLYGASCLCDALVLIK